MVHAERDVEDEVVQSVRRSGGVRDPEAPL